MNTQRRQQRQQHFARGEQQKGGQGCCTSDNPGNILCTQNSLSFLIIDMSRLSLSFSCSLFPSFLPAEYVKKASLPVVDTAGKDSAFSDSHLLSLPSGNCNAAWLQTHCTFRDHSACKVSRGHLWLQTHSTLPSEIIRNGKCKGLKRTLHCIQRAFLT